MIDRWYPDPIPIIPEPNPNPWVGIKDRLDGNTTSSPSKSEPTMTPDNLFPRESEESTTKKTIVVPVPKVCIFLLPYKNDSNLFQMLCRYKSHHATISFLGTS